MNKTDKLFIFGFIVLGLLGLGLLIQNILVKGSVLFDIFCGLFIPISLVTVRNIVRESRKGTGK